MILSLDSILNLEKHSGRTLKQVICGFSSGKKEELLDEFLKDYVNFFKGETEYDILLPKFFENSYYKKQIIKNNYNNSYLKFNSGINYMESIQYVDYNCILFSQYLEQDEKNKISRFLEDTLSTEFQYNVPFFASYKNRKKPFLTNNIKNCFAEPDYISWCILNLDHFALDENAIEKEYNISSLSKIEIIPINHRLNETLIGINTLHGYSLHYDKTCSVVCKPILVEQKFKFNENVKKKNYSNLKKIESFNSYKYSNARNYEEEDMDDDLKTFYSDNPDYRG